MTTVVLVRHGETDWNAEGRMQGWAPVPLNDRGRAQASAAARWLADEFDVDRVQASDLRRTRETAERLLATLSVTDEAVRYDPAWRERDLGIYQGLVHETVREQYPQFSLGEAGADAADRSPDSGESLAAVAERVIGAFGDLVAAIPDEGTALVVTHGGPIHLLSGHVKGFDIERAVLEHATDNCGLVVVECDARGVAGYRSSETDGGPEPGSEPEYGTAPGAEIVRENVTDWLAGTDLDADQVW